MAQKFLNGIAVTGTGSFTDQVTIPETPTADAHAASKKYVDDQVLTGVDVAKRIEISVKNISGGQLIKGTVVHAAPSANPPNGNLVEVVAADYDAEANMPAIGILNETLADDAEGVAVMMGAVSGIDTDDFTAGDELYVGADGALTNSKPQTAGQLIQKIAVCVKSHASNGLIKVFGAGRSNDVPLPLYIDNTNQRLGIRTSTPSSVLDVHGSLGQLFSVTDDLSGDLFSVSDISGMPIFNVNSSGAVDIDGTLNLGDSDKIQLGASQDLQIYHDGSASYISEVGTGDLIISADNDLTFKDGSGNIMANMNASNSVELMFGNVKKFETTSTGVTVTGGWVTSGVSVAQANVEHTDNTKALFGNGNDLEIYHDGSHSYVKDTGTGNLTLSGTNLYLTTNDGQILFKGITDAETGLYYDNSLKLETTSTGITVTDNVNSSTISIDDYITHNGDADTYFGFPTANEFKLVAGGSNKFAADANAAYLYYQGNAKLQTTNTGVNVTGEGTFAGDVTTDGIFKVDTAPDDNILEVTQSGRKMALKTSFAGDTVGSFWAFRVSDGNVNGGTTDALIVRPQKATFAGDIRLPNGGKLYTWLDHDLNYLKYDIWRASAAAGMTIENISSEGEIYLKSGNALALTLDDSQKATFAGTVNISPGSTAIGTLNLRRNTTGDSTIVGDINFLTTAAEGTDDRIGLIRVQTSAGDATTRGGEMRVYTRQSGSSAFNTTIYDKAGNWSLPSNLTVGGNLTVEGTVTTLNTQTVEVEDNILQLNTTQGSPDTATATTSGISIYRGDGVTQASFIFDDGDDTWDLTNNLKVAGTTYLDGFVTIDHNLDITSSGVIRMGGTEVISAARAINATSGTFSGGLTISGSVDSGASDYGYYQSAGTNIVLKGDSVGRSGIFFESEKDGTNINDPSDYGFIQFHSYGYGNTSGEANNLVIGVANDSTDKVILQAPYNGGVMVGYKDATSGTGLTLSEVIHSNSSSYNNGNWNTAYTHSQAAHAPSNAEANVYSNATELLTGLNTLTNPIFTDGLSKKNSRYHSGITSEYPLGHYSPGETLFEIDPTWDDEELKSYFNSSGVSWATEANAPGGYSIYINGQVGVGSAYSSGFPLIPIDEDATYYQECWIKNAGSGQTHYMGSTELEADLTNPASGAGNPGSYGYWVMSNQNPTTTWTKVSGYITGHHASNTGAFETNATYFSPLALFNWGAGTGTRACYISGWKVIRVDKVGDRIFQDDVQVKGKLEVHTLDANTSSTTALVMNNNEVEKRTLGSRAFDSTSYLPLAGGTMTGVAGVVFPDAFKLNLGTGSDLEIYHNGTTGNNNIDNISGDLYISQYANDKDIIFRSDNGSGGVENYIQIDGSAGRTLFNKNIRVNDNVQVQAGNSADLQIYHDGNDSYISDTGTGLLFIRSSGARIQATNGNNGITFNEGGSVDLYHNNNLKFATTSTGVSVTGNLKINDALIDNASVTSATTTTTVASVSGITYAAVFFDYVIYKSSNIRAGTVVACSDGTNVSFTETSTTDLGDTSDVTLAVDYSSSNFRLRATTTSSTWNIKAIIRAI